MESITNAQDVAAIWFTGFFILCLIIPMIGDAFGRKRK